MEEPGRHGRRHKQLLDDLKETENTGCQNRKHQITLSGELTLEDNLDVS